LEVEVEPEVLEFLLELVGQHPDTFPDFLINKGGQQLLLEMEQMVQQLLMVKVGLGE
jgi:triphosphoribosyl-dephospho-CoA synthetase